MHFPFSFRSDGKFNYENRETMKNKTTGGHAHMLLHMPMCPWSPSSASTVNVGLDFPSLFLIILRLDPSGCVYEWETFWPACKWQVWFHFACHWKIASDSFFFFFLPPTGLRFCKPRSQWISVNVQIYRLCLWTSITLYMLLVLLLLRLKFKVPEGVCPCFSHMDKDNFCFSAHTHTKAHTHLVWEKHRGRLQSFYKVGVLQSGTVWRW